MTLEEAIEELEDILLNIAPDEPPKQRNAIKLLIEAGKRIKLGRTGVQRFAHNLLPSETKD